MITSRLRFSRFPLLTALSLVLAACSSTAAQQSSENDTSTLNHIKIAQPCGDKPNCVSTLDARQDFQLAPFTLTEKGEKYWKAVKRVATQLPGARMVEDKPDYIRIECTSQVFKFVDDFEVQRDGNQLIVRSASRVGYYDFGVNRDRADQFRELLKAQGYLQ